MQAFRAGVLCRCFVQAFCAGVSCRRFVQVFCAGVLCRRLVQAFCAGVDSWTGNVVLRPTLNRDEEGLDSVWRFDVEPRQRRIGFRFIKPIRR